MSFKSTINPMFRSKFAEDIFNQKYRHEGCETWEKLSRTIVEDVCGKFLAKSVREQLFEYIRDMKFIPGGRFLYYAGRPRKFFSNCFLLKAEEDTREDWADLVWKTTSCLMIGGGVGIDYSVYRGAGEKLRDTGGVASGPLPAMRMINEIGRNVMQGGSRRSALYASLSREHADIQAFLHAKDWSKEDRRRKAEDFNYPCALDMTNVSVNYGDKWWNPFDPHKDPVFLENIRQAIKTGEPGFSFNFCEKAKETLRNACTEVTSEDDSDRCQLGSVNMGRIETLREFSDVCSLGTAFLLCSTIVGEYPYPKVAKVNEKNRRLGLGIMGVHEWLLKRGKTYGDDFELGYWLTLYQRVTDTRAKALAHCLNVSTPVATRAIAPTGTIGILAGTTTGIEPLYAVAYRRRYLKGGTDWAYQYVVDSAAEDLIQRYGLDPNSIETSVDLSRDLEGIERRISFQAFVQRYVDQGISSTINLPEPSEDPEMVEGLAKVVAKYATKLRGLTFYPDGARGGQPLTSVPYWLAKKKEGVEEFETVTHDVCDISGKGGSCGV